MFNKDFDPYESLIQLNKMVEQLKTLHKQNTELQRQMVEQINKQTEAINAHDLQLNHMHGRLRLLEVVRQYENTTEDNIIQGQDSNESLGRQDT